MSIYVKRGTDGLGGFDTIKRLNKQKKPHGCGFLSVMLLPNGGTSPPSSSYFACISSLYVWNLCADLRNRFPSESVAVVVL